MQRQVNLWLSIVKFNLAVSVQVYNKLNKFAISLKSCFVRGSSSCVPLQLKKPNVNSNRSFFSIKLNQWLSTPRMANNTNGTFVVTKWPPGVDIFFIALDIFLSISSTLGNALILVALRNVSSIHPPTKLLFRCLAVTDFCVGLICQPLYICFIIGNLAIKLWYVSIFFYAFLLTVSPLTSAAISVDRLLALLLGLRYRHVVTLCRVRVAIACVWFIAVSNASLLWVLFIQWSFKVYLASWWTFIALIMVSIIISLFSYMKIFFTLRHQQAQAQNHVQLEQSSTVRSVLNIARYKKTVYSVAWIQLAMLACYGPNIVMAFLRHFGNVGYSTELMIAIEVSVSLFFLNSSLNPVLYCWRIKDVRQEVKNTIRKCLCC